MSYKRPGQPTLQEVFSKQRCLRAPATPATLLSSSQEGQALHSAIAAVTNSSDNDVKPAGLQKPLQLSNSCDSHVTPAATKSLQLPKFQAGLDALKQELQQTLQRASRGRLSDDQEKATVWACVLLEDIGERYPRLTCTPTYVSVVLWECQQVIQQLSAALV